MTTKRILMTGNEAMAEGAIVAGCRFYAGYPITPQNELTAYMARKMPEANGVFIQAESELGAINMVYGAAAAGERAMTSSSSPGMSLKQEGISYIAGAELPALIINVMRGGPGLGNISPAQSDYFQATRGGGHGDYHAIVISPASVQEAYEMPALSFKLADTYRTPVIILSDGMLGQMMEPVEIKPHAASRMPQVKKPWALRGCSGRKPNIIKSFYMHEGELEKFNLSLQQKYAAIKKKEQRFESLYTEDAKIILVAYGSMARIAKSAVEVLRGKAKKVGYFRPITLWPFPVDGLRRLARQKKGTQFLVIEMSYGQMLEDVQLAVGTERVSFLGRAGGGIPTEEQIVKKARSLL